MRKVIGCLSQHGRVLEKGLKRKRMADETLNLAPMYFHVRWKTQDYVVLRENYARLVYVSIWGKGQHIRDLEEGINTDECSKSSLLGDESF